MKQHFGCTNIRRCTDCKEHRTCTRREAKSYRNFIKKRNDMLEQNHNFLCNYVQGRCKLKKCDRYKLCLKKEKENLKAWKRAYETDQSEELDKLMRGGL